MSPASKKADLGLSLLRGPLPPKSNGSGSCRFSSVIFSWERLAGLAVGEMMGDV